MNTADSNLIARLENRIRDLEQGIRARDAYIQSLLLIASEATATPRKRTGRKA